MVFFVLNGIGLLIYYACIGLTDLAGQGKSKLWYNVALVVGTGLGTLFRFWSYRKWVWVAADEQRPGGSRSRRRTWPRTSPRWSARRPVSHHAAGRTAPGAPRVPQSRSLARSRGPHNGATPVSQTGTGSAPAAGTRTAPTAWAHRRTSIAICSRA